MSVIVTMVLEGDPAALEGLAGRDPEAMQAIAERAKGAGATAHRFYGSDDGRIMVVDEWPDRESFESFFAGEQETIGPMMQEVGASGEPQATFWRKLDTHDEIGWGA